MSRKSPDILPPCGGYQIPSFSGCWQHYLTGSESQSVWENVTKVVDYSDTAWVGTGIAPYERPWELRNQFCWAYQAGGDDCQVQAAGGVGATGYPSRDYPTTCSFLDCIAAPAGYVGSRTVNESIYHNCYIKSASTTNMAECKYIGFKSLLAKKMWHGRQSFTSRDLNYPYDGFSWCCTCYIHNYDPDPDPTKYLQANGTGDYSFTSGAPSEHTIEGHATCHATVERYSGHTTQTATSGSSCTGDGCPEPAEYYAAIYAGYALGQAVAWANGDVGLLLSTYCSVMTTNTNAYGTPSGASGGSGTSWTLTWAYDLSPAGAQAVLTIDFEAFSLTYSHETAMYDSETDTWSKYTDESDTINYSATGMSYTHYDHGACPDQGPDFGHTDISATATLSDTYSSSDLLADWLDLINNQFDEEFVSEVWYPWRYRSYENNRYAPMIARDEVYGSPFCTGDNSVGGTDWLYDGTVNGNSSTIPTAPFWNGKHTMYEYIQCTEEGSPSWKQRGYGQWGGFSGIPNCSTLWPTLMELYNDVSGYGTPEGAFLRFDNPTLYGAVNAQILQGAKGYNWARPCGPIDRFQLDTDASNCISEVSASAVILSNYGGQTDNIAGGVCTASIWGTGTYADGVWIVSSTDFTCSLIRQIVSGSDVPAYPWGYATDTTFANGMICKNRWFAQTPPFCGHVDITSITVATPVTISLMEAQQGIVLGDEVWVRGCQGGLGNTTWKLIPLGSPYNQFALSGSTTASVSSTPYTASSGWVQVPFAKDWKWDSDLSRQTYVIGTFDLNSYLRPYGEYLRLQAQSASNCQFGVCDFDVENPVYCPIGSMISETPYPSAFYTHSCMSFNACNPNVIFYRPSGFDSDFSAQNTHDIPTNIVCDVKYGNWWQGWFIQTMPDPLWPGATPCPCSPAIDPETEETIGYECDCTWTNDGGWCLGKQTADPELGIPCIDYYAAADIYEAVAENPPGAPPLPEGLHVTQSFYIPGIGSIYPTVSQIGLKPWYDWLVRENCVCSSGRMSPYYIRNGFECLAEDPPLV